LLIAAKNTTVDHVKLLLYHGADITTSKFGRHILHFATKAPQPIELCTFLLDNYSDQLDINKANKYNETPLAFACIQLNLPLVQLFLQHGANVDMTYGSILHYLAVHQSSRNTNNSKMTQHPSYDRYYNDYYVKLDPTPIIDSLMKEYPHLKVDCARSDGQTPFHFACKLGNLFGMAAFIKHGADITRRRSRCGSNALVMAHPNSIKWLADNYNDEFVIMLEQVNDAGNTPLLTTLFHRLFQPATALLENGANINVVTNDGHCVLSLLLSERDMEAYDMVNYIMINYGDKIQPQVEQCFENIFDLILPQLLLDPNNSIGYPQSIIDARHDRMLAFGYTSYDDYYQIITSMLMLIH
jgi:ankyrin repeat protein